MDAPDFRTKALQYSIRVMYHIILGRSAVPTAGPPV
jgi:hypothetical protein